ncbi:MAG: hypothetical protein SWO11_07650 [Thermodesulfobacteriota bacterium]|nr:hypothetical protein [Thermodesulfobacteriota bacterium]
MFIYRKNGFENIQDDWLEVGHLEFYPCDNVLTLKKIKGDKILKEFDQKQIHEWVSTVCDLQIDHPYIDARRGYIAFIFDGSLRSVMSKGGKSFRSFQKTGMPNNSNG